MSSYKANILLVNPWIVDFAAYDFWIKPVGLLIIANILRENNYKVNLLDCLDRNHFLLTSSTKYSDSNYKSYGTGHFFKEHIKKPNILEWIPRYYSRYGLPYTLVKSFLQGLKAPDVILVTSSMTYWYPGVVEIIKLLRNMYPTVPVVLGGIYATLYYQHAKRVTGADYIITGEGEEQALELVDQLTGNTSYVKKYQELDDFPYPAYDLYSSLDSVALLSSRGCPYNCPVCASNILSGRYRRRSIAEIIKEITYFHKQLKVNDFAFYDDALLYMKNEHIIPLLQAVNDNNLHIRFHIPNGIQPREVDHTVANLMKITGFKKINLSYESINCKRQKAFSTKVTDADLDSAVRNLLYGGFKKKDISAYVLMGLPHQDLKEVIDSILFVYSLGIKVSLASFSPIKGTEYWKQMVETGTLPDNGDPLLTNNSIFPLYKRDYDRFITLRTLTGTGNQYISEGINPLNQTAYVNKLKKVIK